MSELAKRGPELFFGKAGCNKCHLGQNFTDSRFHNLGVGWNPERGDFSDEGRYPVTKKEADRGAFKTPTLREEGYHDTPPISFPAVDRKSRSETDVARAS